MPNDFTVIIVEDEPLIALMTEELLQEMGCRVAAIALNGDDAFAALIDRQIDVALLDVNLGGTSSLAFARECEKRGISVIFVTGYSVRDLPPECLGWPVVPKPFSLDQMQMALDAVRSERRNVGE